MHPNAPALRLAAGSGTPARHLVLLPDIDGHPDRFLPILDALERPWSKWRALPHAQLVKPERCIARWRYTLDARGRVSRVDHAAHPGYWTPHILRG